MDPFNSHFDAEKALHSLGIPPSLNIQPSTSFDAFERELLTNNPGLSNALRLIDEAETVKKKSTPTPGKVSTKQRMKSLEAICVENKTPLTIVNKSKSKTIREMRKLTKSLAIATENGGQQYSVSSQLQQSSSDAVSSSKSFATDTMGCLRKWMANRSRVFVKVRAQSSTHSPEPNRLLQGVIVAFDKHWNLVLRDVDECYTPSLRLGKIQCSENAMPKSVVYSADSGSTEAGQRLVLYRHLKCSMLTGNSIVCIYEPQQT